MKEFRDFEDMEDIARLRVAIGFEDSFDSPVQTVLDNATLTKVCKEIYYDGSKEIGERNVKYFAGQETQFLKCFNNIFSWPILGSQIMPRISSKGKEKEISMTFADYVSQMSSSME